MIDDALSEGLQAVSFGFSRALHKGADSPVLIAPMWFSYTYNLNTVVGPGVVVELVNVTGQLARNLAGALAAFTAAFAVDTEFGETGCGSRGGGEEECEDGECDLHDENSFKHLNSV
jgi:hypothetical protein